MEFWSQFEEKGRYFCSLKQNLLFFETKYTIDVNGNDFCMCCLNFSTLGSQKHPTVFSVLHIPLAYSFQNQFKTKNYRTKKLMSFIRFTWMLHHSQTKKQISIFRQLARFWFKFMVCDRSGQFVLLIQFINGFLEWKLSSFIKLL